MATSPDSVFSTVNSDFYLDIDLKKTNKFRALATAKNAWVIFTKPKKPVKNLFFRTVVDFVRQTPDDFPKSLFLVLLFFHLDW